MLTVTYYTVDLSQAAHYTVSISVFNDGVDTGHFIQYGVTFHDPCLDVVPLIDPTILSEADLIYDYELFQGDVTESLDAAKVTSPELIITCPVIEEMELQCGNGAAGYYICTI